MIKDLNQKKNKALKNSFCSTSPVVKEFVLQSLSAHHGKGKGHDSNTESCEKKMESKVKDNRIKPRSPYKKCHLI